MIVTFGFISIKNTQHWFHLVSSVSTDAHRRASLCECEKKSVSFEIATAVILIWQVVFGKKTSADILSLLEMRHKSAID